MNHHERVWTAIHYPAPERILADAIWIKNLDAVGRFLQIAADSVIERLRIDGRCVAADRYAREVPIHEGKNLSPLGTESDDGYGTARIHSLASASSVVDVERHR